MRNKFLNRIVSGVLTAAVGIACVPPVFQVSAADQCDQGVQDGMDWELWNQNYQGNASMQLKGNGAFSASWSGIENYLARTGKKWTSNSPQWESLGDIRMYYDADYRPNGNSYLAVYGWTRNSLVEYYIIENFGTWRPPGGQGFKGTITVDGHIYDVYQAMRYNQPSIDGTATFPQYFSVRRDNDKSSKGKVDITKHFAEWEKLGLDMGSQLYEVSLVVEGYQSSGSADVKTNYLTIGGKAVNTGPAPDWIDEDIDPTPTPTPDPEDEVKYSTPSGSGSGVTDDFEGSGTDWTGRGVSSYGITSDFAHGGSKSLYVEGREQAWHGFTIASDELQAGSSYDISAYAGFKSNNYSSLGFTLGLQYTSGGEEVYENLVDATGSSGKWSQLATDFSIPSGATNISLYVQSAYTESPTAADLVSFFIDDVVLTKENESDITTTTTPPATDEPQDVVWGDANGNGTVEIADAVYILQSIASPNSYKLSTQAAKNADVNLSGNGVDAEDALAIQKYIANIISKLPESYSNNAQQTTKATTTTKTTTATTTTEKINSVDGKAYMESISKSITANVPSNITAGANNGCKDERITYYSSIAKKNKNAVVILPPNYTTSKKYPVVYVNHGIFGSENDMVGDCKTIGGNLMAAGEAEEMILVSCAMYTRQNTDQCNGFTAEECARYDAFREDLIECLMPYMEEHYSIKTGRENTAICGFSMGGRESLYIGITRPQYFGYIGAACPAPGITPASDSYMVHPGNMQPSEFKIQDHTYDPYILMITGGTNDAVVGTFPKQYHETLTTNGQPHIWQEIQGGGHDASCINPLMYNFLKNAFKAGK